MQRKTPQRQAIKETLLASPHPLSPEEILDAARQGVPKLGLATVYRALKALEDEDWLNTLEIPGKGKCFEIANHPHRHYFHCRVCGRVLAIVSCPKGLETLAPEGYTVERHELTLHGICADCQ